MSDKRTPQGLRVGDAGHTIFGPPNGNPLPETIATVKKPDYARFIVRACNAHDELVAALKSIAEGEVMDQSKPYSHADTVHTYQRIAREALRKTEGQGEPK